MNKPLQKQLIKLQNKDQEMRASGTWDEKIDFTNTKTLKKIIEKYGWPDEILVGKEGTEAAWLIAQHADHDLNFQKTCFALMQTHKSPISKIHLAYLSDRINVNEGKKQKYGTQFYFDKKSNKLLPQPIADKKNIEIRRKRIGLEPFKEYAKRLKQKNSELKKKSL